MVKINWYKNIMLGSLISALALTLYFNTTKCILQLIF